MRLRRIAGNPMTPMHVPHAPVTLRLSPSCTTLRSNTSVATTPGRLGGDRKAALGMMDSWPSGERAKTISATPACTMGSEHVGARARQGYIGL